MDLNEEINTATAKIVAEKLPKMVEEKATKMLDSVLEDIFRSYSDMAKQLKEKVEKQLNVNLQEYDLLDYNAMISKAINDRLVGIVNEGSIKPIMQLIGDTVGFLEKKTITLSEIFDIVKEAAMEELSWEPSGQFSFHVEQDRPNKWYTVSIDTDKGKDASECSLQFLFSYKEGNTGPTIAAADITAMTTMEQFIVRQFTEGGGQLCSINNPAGSVLSVPKLNLMSPEELKDSPWIMNTNFDNVGVSINDPAPTVMAGRHHAYLMSHHFNDGTSPIDTAGPTVIAQQGKKPLHLIHVDYGTASYCGIVLYKSDSDAVKALKLFMAVYGIVDIKMRMLKVPELLRIQGFPIGYILKGSTTEQKKFIGNAVECTIAQKLAEAYGPYYYNQQKQAASA